MNNEFRRKQVRKEVEAEVKAEYGNGEEYVGVGGFILEIVKVVILAFVIIAPIRIFLFQPFFVQGASMEPNFEDSQYLIVNEFGLKEVDFKIGSHSFFKVEPFKELERQQTVVFRYPLDGSKFFIKRVIGLPGEKIQIKDGQVIIFNKENPDGFVLDEKDYLPIGLKTKGDNITNLKDNEYFVLGDNRMFSSDSRAWGPLPKSDVIGKVIFRAWPLNRVAVY